MKNKFLFILFSVLSCLAFGQCGETGLFVMGGNIIQPLFETDREGNLISIKRDDNQLYIITKYDQSRNVLATKTIGPYAGIANLVIDHENNYYISGGFSYHVDFGSGFIYNTNTNFSYFAKLNSALQTQWVTLSTYFPGIQNQGAASISSLSVDSLGSLYFTGTYVTQFAMGSVSISSPFYNQPSSVYGKLNSQTGQTNWMKSIHNSGSFGYNQTGMIEANDSNGACLIIDFGMTINFPNYQTFTVGPVWNMRNTVILGIDSLGNALWNHQLKGETEVIATQRNETHDVLVIGRLNDTLSCTVDTISNLFFKGLYLAQINMDGTFDRLERIATSPYTNYFTMYRKNFHYTGNGTFFLSGESLEDANFNGLISDHTTNNYIYFITRYDQYVTPVWNKSFGYGDISNGYSVRAVNDCSLYFAGDFFEFFNYDPQNAYPFSPFEQRLFIFEFNASTGELADTNSIVDDPFGQNGAGLDDLLFNSISVSPNPAMNEINISNAAGEKYQLTIMDVKGKTLLTQIIQEKTKTIETHNLEAGIYYMTFESHGNKMTKKIVKL